MENKEIKIPTISVIGGIGQGKTSLIEALWKDSSVMKSDNGVVYYSVRESIPGRGNMDFQIKELPSIVYSLQKEWFKNKSILKEIASSEVILFLVPASSFGYKQEISFFRELIKSDYYTNQHVVICLSKSDYLLLDDNCKNVELNSVAKLLQISNTLYNAFSKDLTQESFSCDSIIPVSIL